MKEMDLQVEKKCMEVIAVDIHCRLQTVDMDALKGKWLSSEEKVR